MADAAEVQDVSQGKNIWGKLGFAGISLVVLGATQLVAWLGNGMADPFLTGFTILQSTALFAALIQIVAFVPSYLWQTEKFYDLTGSVTYLLCIGYSLGAGIHAKEESSTEADPRAIAVSLMVIAWASRLGYFLFRRVMQAGKDSRFAHIMPVPSYFFLVWALQALWVTLGVLPAFIVNATQTRISYLVWSDIVGGSFFLLGFGLEIVADWQKSTWRADSSNKGKWIEVGLWYYSRHPNYFGEITLNCGMFIFCTIEFTSSQWIAVLGPIWVSILLLFVSGIPLLEKEGMRRWGTNPEYIAYKKRTSILVPLPKLGENTPTCLI